MNLPLIDIESELAALRERAPDPIVRDVLVGAGIADAFVRASSPVGDLLIAASMQGITRVTLAGDEGAFQHEYTREFGRAVHASTRLPTTLRPFAAGLFKPPRSISFDLRSRSAFERAVLLKAVEIPSGEVRPYGWIAREIGRPHAVRAVGTALKHNPIPLLIPCHRVVRTDGRLGRYSLGGPAFKRALLAYEGTDPEELEALAARGIRYLASGTTGIYCYPTCRNARRITQAHRVELRSRRDAEARRLRPCLLCRPVVAA